MDSSSRAASRKTRVYVFREFLLQNYQLSARDVVLDAAGGAGCLSWLLKNVDDIESVVLDPRMTRTNRMEKSVFYLREHPEQAKERSIPNLPTYQPLAPLISNPLMRDKSKFSSPSQMRILVDDDLVEAIRNYKITNDMADWMNYWSSALEKGQNTDTLGYKEKRNPSVGEITDAVRALQTILSSKLIVGFHPDQATDSSIDLAKELSMFFLYRMIGFAVVFDSFKNVLAGIPFCIVPCCVFPSEFPSRRLADGTHVRCYNQLLEYLLESKASPDIIIHQAKLSFSFTETAKNICLFTSPFSGNDDKRD
jgi:hypothetical protein